MARASTEDFLIDFADEQQGGGGKRIHVPEARYKVRVLSAKATTASTGTIGLELMLKIVAGKFKGKVFTETLWKSPKSYHRYRELLAATGKKAPARVDLRKIAQVVKGALFFVELEDEIDDQGKYKTRSRVSFQDGFVSVDKADEDDEDDDDLDEDDEEEDEDEDEDDELAGMDRAELKAHIKSEGLDVRVTKSMSDDDIRTAIAEASDEDDEEEEEPSPPRRRTAAKPAARTRTKAAATPARRRKATKPVDDEDDLDSLDLSDF